ncbi:MAG TPA: hypothetical protein VFG10_09785 [Saprospiraceae bacterium]|nr:hypothetical protein [Saprospiraceae bacterium]
MKQLLDMIQGFFEEEARKVESGELKEENMLLEFNELQTDDTNTKRPIRQLPAGFDQRRA